MTLSLSPVAMCAPHHLCHPPNCPLGLPSASAPLQPGLCLRHGQDLGDSQQPQHHEEQWVRAAHTGEIQAEERACAAAVPRIF